MAFTFTLNGELVEIDGVDPNTTLLQWLRGRGLTGTKEGCAEGECGACAVAVVRTDAAGRTLYHSLNSCLLLLGACADQEIVTVEGVARGEELHPVQRAMVDAGGSQCGYCTPGFVVSLFAEYYRPGRDGYDPEAIGGNLCRCTGYRPIRDVATGLGTPSPDDPFQQRLANTAPALSTLTYAAGGRHFLRPRSLAEAFTAMRAHPDAILVAGGTDVVVEANQRGKRWETLISLDAVEELHAFEWRDDAVRIGAGVALAELEERVRGKLPMLEQLLPLFSSRLIRNRATLGGNLATASPIGDSPPALLALDAEVEIASAGGERRLPLDQLFTGYRKTALAKGELIRAVVIPLPLPDVTRFYKVSKRVLDDISTVAAGMSLRFAADGTIAAARLAYGGVAATPARAVLAENALVGQRWSADSVAKARAALAKTFQPLDDHRGSAEYRRAMVTALFDKFHHETANGGAP